mmetsp:Transcript_13934/g.56103  ORF Transcript_13934/g.56103 Transcript_13934/m.56103 type:complete len:112 (-) Transcript_13934:1490-1825(-)
MTFPGMAEVLGWEPRKPTCSSKQREEIFNAWSEELSTNIYAVEIPFSKIRSLKPKEFIEFVVDDFNTSAVSSTRCQSKHNIIAASKMPLPPKPIVVDIVDDFLSTTQLYGH